MLEAGWMLVAGAVRRLQPPHACPLHGARHPTAPARQLRCIPRTRRPYHPQTGTRSATCRPWRACTASARPSPCTCASRVGAAASQPGVVEGPCTARLHRACAARCQLAVSTPATSPPAVQPATSPPGRCTACAPPPRWRSACSSGPRRSCTWIKWSTGPGPQVGWAGLGRGAVGGRQGRAREGKRSGLLLPARPLSAPIF